MELPDQERAWWDEIAAGPDMAGNVYDESIGTAEDCLAEILPALALDISVDRSVLDLGCGTGRLLGPLAHLRALHLTGIDISERIIDHARAREDLRRVQFWVCDGRTIPAAAGDGFDAVYSMGLFQHLPAEACAGYVREVARVLRPGGRFRFQSVLGDEHAFLSHQTTASDMVRWCSDAGLIVDGHDSSRLKPEWYWITARKP